MIEASQTFALLSKRVFRVTSSADFIASFTTISAVARNLRSGFRGRLRSRNL